MNLSNNTSLSLKPDKGLVLTRIRKDDESYKEMFINSVDYAALSGHLTDIAETIDTMLKKAEGEMQMIPFSESWTVEVNKFKGQVYCGLWAYKNGQINRRVGMNFNLVEWGKLAQFLSASQRLEVPQAPKKKRPNPSEDNNDDDRCIPDYVLMYVDLYRWKWIHDGQTIREADKWYFSDQVCVESALDNRPHSPGSVEIDYKTMNIPHDGNFLDNMYLFLLEQKIKDAMVNDCEGCEMDCPGQSDHMNGCLMPWEEGVIKHLKDVKDLVNGKHLLQLYHQMKKFLIRRVSYTKTTLLERMVNYSPPQNLEEMLARFPHQQIIYYDLLTDCYTI